MVTLIGMDLTKSMLLFGAIFALSWATRLGQEVNVHEEGTNENSSAKVKKVR